ncbi:peptidase M50 [Mycolicibacterium sp. P1-5]|uniref:peptidase M50 n=1 Tax=Mycolicibacterium sp. P1-5 TaxID=2024617 RepID=UPI0011EDA54B|nr:peptidase M50 [Mycolicibacterium sp. P1-5]KAA0111478.1 peptidase M50 [Mycolicibacterium sp. P1-5]
MTNINIAVLRFGGRRLPRALASLPCHNGDDTAGIDAAAQVAARVVVVGSSADLAVVLTRLMRIERLDVEVAPVPRWRGARRAITGVAQRVPLIRDETGSVVVEAAFWLPPGEDRVIQGEAVVDDQVLFDGEATAVRIEPTASMPGLRAAVLTGRMRPRRWLTGRAVQLGATGARVMRDGVLLPREAKRSAFYRHTTGWLRVS